MTVRRVITDEVDGKSRILTDSEAPNIWCDEIWMATPELPYGCDSGAGPQPLQPAPGAAYFRIVSLDPDHVVRAALAQVSEQQGEIHQDIDAEGFHQTDTIDYLFILDGPVELILDEGSTILQPGDCVVQRGTRHAWRNHGDKPIRLLTVMVGTTR
ncbi:cupin domain-containing protein [Streptomyces sp. NPDC002577]